VRYSKPKSGEWVKPKRKYYKMACCDCGLVHKMEFALFPTTNGKGIYFRAWRDERATGQMRRKRG